MLRLMTFACVAGVLGLAGCGGESYSGPPLANVTGTVKYNGAAVEGATVTMQSDTTTSTAVTDASGAFVMTTTSGGTSYDGVPVGSVRVMITKFPSAGVAEGEVDDSGMPAGFEQMTGAEGPKNELPEKYSLTPNDLGRDVVAGDNKFDFELTD